MGLLDDAIREHLELKRQRGADPNEIERLEREALGPVRRAPHDSESVLLEETDAVAPSFPEDDEPALELEPGLFDHDADDGVEEPSEFADPPEFGSPADFEPPTEIAPRPALEPEADPAVREPARHHEIAEEWEAHQRQSLVEESGGAEPEAPPATAPPPAPAAPPVDVEPISPAPAVHEESHPHEPLVEQETAEYRVEDEHEQGPGGEDMLEETPEFLQDTPDHDRLWFEQRPPRDFDLDK